MIEIGLAQFLTAEPSVRAIVVDNQLARIFPLLIPEHVRGDPKKMPCVVYQRVATQRTSTFCRTDSLVQVTMQIDCYALKFVEVKTLANVIRRALVDYTGPMGDTHVDRVFSDVEFDLIETDTGLYRVSQTYSIWFVET